MLMITQAPEVKAPRGKEAWEAQQTKDYTKALMSAPIAVLFVYVFIIGMYVAFGN